MLFTEMLSLYFNFSSPCKQIWPEGSWSMRQGKSELQWKSSLVLVRTWRSGHRCGLSFII